MPPSPVAAASPSNSSPASASDPTPSWWESVSQARSRILVLASILPPTASADVAALADSDRPARALLRSSAAYAALSGALRAGGGADDPACHWLYDTLLSPDPDLRLAALAFLPLLSSLYLLRLPPALPSSLSGFEAVLLAVYSSEAKNRHGKPVLVQVPDLSVPSLYHTPLSSPTSKSPRRPQPQPPPIPPPPANVVVGVLSQPLEPQAAVKSTKRAGIIGVAFEAYYAKISQMPATTKVDACDAVASWAGQYCRCRFELDEKESEEEGDSLGSVSPVSSEAENGKVLEEELARMRVNGDSSGRNCGEEVKEARVPLPWELLQPAMRVLGHCLLAPLNPMEVRDAAAEAVRVVYARACHDLIPQAILASRSLIELDKSARKAAKAAASGATVAVHTAGSTASSSKPSSKPNTPSSRHACVASTQQTTHWTCMWLLTSNDHTCLYRQEAAYSLNINSEKCGSDWELL